MLQSNISWNNHVT